MEREAKMSIMGVNWSDLNRWIGLRPLTLNDSDDNRIEEILFSVKK